MTQITENTVSNTDISKPWLFQPGQSGNPLGKPVGTKHRATIAAQTLLDGEVEALTRKAIDLALSGDIGALKLCLDRIIPALKPQAQAVMLDQPLPNSLTETARAFMNAAAKGQISPNIAAQLVSAVASIARVEELEDIKHRLEGLERALKGSKK